MGKHHIGQTGMSLLEIHVNKNHPFTIENLTEEQVDRKLAALLPILEREYGHNKPNSWK
jgi:hypothetical protein